MNPNQFFTGNKFVNKVMSWIPEDPLTQSKFIYYLTITVFVGLMGYALATWYAVIFYFAWKNLFQGLFMTAIAILSLFGLKQTRKQYYMLKNMYTQQNNIKLEVESPDKMMGAFK